MSDSKEPGWASQLVKPEEPSMNPKQYIETQMRMIEIGKIADSLDVETFLQCLRNAETVAPMVDPTLYLKASANLTAIKKLALSVKQVKIAYGETFRAVMETTMKGNMQMPGGKNDV